MPLRSSSGCHSTASPAPKAAGEASAQPDNVCLPMPVLSCLRRYSGGGAASLKVTSVWDQLNLSWEGRQGQACRKELLAESFPEERQVARQLSGQYLEMPRLCCVQLGPPLDRSFTSDW